MHSRDLWILGGALALAAVVGVTWFGRTAAAEELPPPVTPDAPAAAAGDPAGHGAPPASPVASALPHAGVPAAAADLVREDTRGWTKGLVRGDIQLAVSVLDRIGSIAVVLEEQRSSFADDGSFRRPNKLHATVHRGRGTPTFEIRDVPFSEYPYVVAVVAPGLNGSRCTVTVDERTPLVDDVVLSILPGTPLTMLVRDQDAVPFHGVDIAAIPVGEPAGRPALRGTTDNFGSLVFEDVLAGDYQLLASLSGQQLIDPQTISVPTGGRSQVRPHSHSLVIERGVPVRLMVHDAGGYPIVGAKVVATATDRVRLTTYETTTDHIGNGLFSRLQPGTWQFTVTMDGWEIWDAQRTLKPHQDPLFVDVRLVRRR